MIFFFYIALALCFLLIILNQPVGFDIFYHFYYLLDKDVEQVFNSNHSIFGFEVKRYILFPEIVRLIDIPVAYSISIITFLCWGKPVKELFWSDNALTKLAIAMSMYFLLFWTPASLSVGLLLTYLICLRDGKHKDSLLFCSVFFHPVSAPLSAITIMFSYFKARSLKLVTKSFAVLFSAVLIIFYISHSLAAERDESTPVINGMNVVKADLHAFENSHIPLAELDSSDGAIDDKDNLGHSVRPPMEANALYSILVRIGSKIKILGIYSLVCLLLCASYYTGRLKCKVKTPVNILLSLSFPVLLVVLGYKGNQNGSLLYAIKYKDELIGSDNYVDFSLQIALEAMGYDHLGKTMLLDGATNCFHVAPRFIDKSYFTYSKGIACFKKKLPDDSKPRIYKISCLLDNPNSDYINVSYFDNLVFKRLLPYSPDYNSLACSTD